MIKKPGMVFDDKHVPAALAVTPDSSPATTLTSAEAEDLQDAFALNMALQTWFVRILSVFLLTVAL